jgi:hypothetical protein
MLVQPKVPGAGSGNPLLNVDSTLSTTSTIVIQALSTAEVDARIERSRGDSYKITKSEGTAADPFIYVTAQSQTPGESVALVNHVLAMAEGTLIDHQRELRVRPSRYIKLASVVDATPPQYIVIGRQTAAAAATLLLGSAITAAAILLCEKLLSTRRREARSKCEQETPRPLATADAVLAAPTVAAPAGSPVAANTDLRSDDGWTNHSNNGRTSRQTSI